MQLYIGITFTCKIDGTFFFQKEHHLSSYPTAFYFVLFASVAKWLSYCYRLRKRHLESFHMWLYALNTNVLYTIKQTYLISLQHNMGGVICSTSGQYKKRLINCSGNRKEDQPFPVKTMRYSCSKGKALLSWLIRNKKQKKEAS